MNGLQFGIDLGGTKTELIVLDDAGRQRFRQRVATPSHSYDAILQCICTLVDTAQKKIGNARALGIGAPGTPFGPQGLIKNANTTCLIGRALGNDLQNMLGIPVVIENDANCLALSEAVDGAASSARCVFAVILGTGVGAGLVVNKQLINGPNRITGEWGHNPMPRWGDRGPLQYASRMCYCGMNDCIETFLCGKGLALTHKEIAGQTLDASIIAKEALNGNPSCKQTIDIYFDQLSASLATVINIVDPDVIVFGGGLSQIDGLCQTVFERLPRYVFSDQVHTELVVAQHGDSSGVRGAAWLCSKVNDH